jgi:hypothetical protein
VPNLLNKCMDAFKIRNFVDSHKGEAFPWCRALDTAECIKIRSQIRKKVPISNSDDGSLLLKAIDQMGNLAKNIGAGDSEFSLNAFLISEGIYAKEKVYLNWKQFDELDEMKYADVCEHFDDIWYPGSDDLDFFDDSFEWVLSIAHHGAIKLAKMGILVGKQFTC